MPGDEWVNPGDVTDTDRLRWLVYEADDDFFFVMPQDLGQAREYIDAAMMPNTAIDQPFKLKPL